MEAAQQRKWLVTGGIAVVIVAAILIYYRVTEPGAPDQRFFKVNTVDTDALDCAANDLIFIAQPQVVQRALPSTPLTAIQDQVTTTYRRVTPGSLEQTVNTSTKATFQFRTDSGDTVAEVDLANSGAGWAVDSFVACDSFLETQV